MEAKKRKIDGCYQNLINLYGVNTYEECQ